MPMLARGFEFALEKYFPTSCILELPTALYAKAPLAPLAPFITGSGYENTQDDGDCKPELIPAIVRLRPNPEELSVTCASW